MKKKYEKPVFVFESFSLDTSIAGSCEVKTNTPSNDACALEWNDEFLGQLNVFTSNIGACTTKEADGEYNGICYHVPAEAYNLFNS